jgi:hypothetical protein|tara:strand:- start:2411 stop:2788 length:378 start_codon:yes stop_codon:yes gene_type:complete
MSNRNSTIDKQIEKRLGISIKTWDKIELTSLGLLVLITARETMDVVGSKGLFGFGKSKKLQKYSRLGFERDTWSNLNVVSSLLGAGLLLKNAIDTVERKTTLFQPVSKISLGGANLQGFTRNRII